MKDAKQFWDDSADKYVKSPIKDQATYEKKLAITREFINKDSRVLEFGCGSGATALRHAPYVKEMVAIDISDRMIELAKQNPDSKGVNNVQFLQGTINHADLVLNSFDAVLGLNVIHLLDDVDGAIKSVHTLLKRGGVFISSTSLIGEVNFLFRGLISAMQLIGIAPHVSNLTQAQLVEKMTQAGFSIEYEWRSSYESVFIVAKKHD